MHLSTRNTRHARHKVPHSSVWQAIGRNAYLIFVGLTFFFGWFTWNKVPETKGKTIAQVTKDFEKYY